MDRLKFIRVTEQLNLEIVFLLDKKTKIQSPVFMDVGTGTAIGLVTKAFKPYSPYSPVGGYPALREILSPGGGFVEGSMLIGFPIKHLHTDEYQNIRVYEQLPFQLARTQALTCLCCGKGFVGRQWFNQDSGYGLGDCCVEFCRTSEKIEFEFKYGINYFNFNIQ